MATSENISIQSHTFAPALCVCVCVCALRKCIHQQFQARAEKQNWLFLPLTLTLYHQWHLDVPVNGDGCVSVNVLCVCKTKFWTRSGPDFRKKEEDIICHLLLRLPKWGWVPALRDTKLLQWRHSKCIYILFLFYFSMRIILMWYCLWTSG